MIWIIMEDICNGNLKGAASQGYLTRKCILAWKTESVALLEYCFNMQQILKVVIWK